MSDRERLERALYDVMDRDDTTSPRFISENWDLAKALADAVDAVRPEPAALSEQWLNDLAAEAGEGGYYPATFDRHAVLRLLAHVRVVEALLTDRCKDTPDRDDLERRGAERERAEIAAQLYARAEGLDAWPIRRTAFLDAASEVEARGPCRADPLHALREEAAELRGVLGELVMAGRPAVEATTTHPRREITPGDRRRHAEALLAAARLLEGKP